MRNSSDIKKNISGRRSIRDNYNTYEEDISSRKKENKDRSISEPPKSNYSIHYMNNNNNRLKTIKEKTIEDVNNQQGSSDDEYNSQLNDESDLDLDIPESASQTPTPTLLTAKSRRINSETNLIDSKRRLTGFLGNRSKRFCASTSELNFASHLDTHKSLFSPKNNQSSRSGSLYGSNMSLNSTNSRLFMVNSPFYNGKTTFGGASSYSKRDINQHKVLRTPIQMRPSSSLSNSSNTSTKSESGGNLLPESNAAKRILEIMTQFNGPLKETRSMGNNISSMIKIPGLVQNRSRFGNEDLQLDRSISLTRPTAPYSRPIMSNSETTPSILNLNSNSPQIPTMSQLLKMKRLQNNTEKVREIANRSENFLNQVHEYKLPSQTDDKQISSSSSMNSSSTANTLKMKSNITKNLLRNDKTVEELPPRPLNLPNIQLPELKSIPKFDIKLPEVSKAPVPAFSNINKNNIKSIAVTPKSSPAPKTTTISFIASTTKTICEPKELPRAMESPKEVPMMKINNSSKFEFSKPIKFTVDDVRHLKATTDSFKFSKAIFIDEKTDKSVLDSKPSTPVKDDLFKKLAAQQKSLWECDSCMTRNEVDRIKCLCCETVRPDSGISSQSSSLSTSALKETSKNAAPQPPPTDDLFKKLASQQKQSQWECSDCMTKNNLDSEKCLCCESPKPGTKPSTTSTASSQSTFKFGMPAAKSDDLFKSIASQQKKTQWECSDCMTSNDSSKDKCVCCEAAKPGSSPQKSSISFGAPVQKFSFGNFGASKSNDDPEFKKIVEKQSKSWECSACMTRNDQSKTKCICCEAMKPGLSENQATFSFGSKMGSSSEVKSSSSGFMFGSSEVKSSSEGKSSSEVKFGTSSEVKFTFGVQPIQPKESSKSEDATAKSSPENDGKSSKELEEVKKDEVDKPKMTFSFGSPAVSKSEAESKSETKMNALPFTFGMKPAVSNTAELSSAPTIIISPADKKPVAFQAKKDETKPTGTVPGGFSFPITSTPLPSTTLKTNGGFSFDGFTKTETPPQKATDDKPTAVGGFQFGATSPFAAVTTTTASSSSQKTTQSAPTFSFGSQNNDDQPKITAPIFGSFGNTTQTTAKFGSSASTVFGQTGFAFGGSNSKKDENTPVFAFGGATTQPATTTNSSNMIFGSNSASNIPSFGSQPSSAPVFGTTKNNENAFGGKLMGFGNVQQSTSLTTVNQSQKRSLDFTSADVPQKKFDLGSQIQQSSPTPFQFNAQPDAPKPAFNFTATSATPQTFNFTGVSSNNASSNNVQQENLFQFGANNSQGIFGVNGQASAPVMQFGTGSVPTVAIQGINAFGPSSQSAANAPQRKILRAARRATRR